MTRVADDDDGSQIVATKMVLRKASNKIRAVKRTYK